MTNEHTPLKLAAKWTDDCQGKKDYDGAIIGISTRYWPRGGGFHILQNNYNGTPIFELSTDPAIKPSAHSSLVIWHGEPHGDYTDLANFSIDGNSFEEIALKIEAWAQAQMDFVVKAVNSHAKLVEALKAMYGLFDEEGNFRELADDQVSHAFDLVDTALWDAGEKVNVRT